MIVEQMEATDYCLNVVRTSRQNVFQSAMSATGKQESVHVQSQFVSEIILNVLPLCILDKEMLITFGHRMNLRDVSYYINIVCNASAMLNRQQSLFGNLRPSRCNAVKMPSV